MAAKTPDSAPETITARSFQGLRHIRAPFLTANIDNGDTWTTGIRNIQAVAWEAVNASDLVAATFAATGVVTFTSTGDNHNGYLHVWSGT